MSFGSKGEIGAALFRLAQEGYSSAQNGGSVNEMRSKIWRFRTKASYLCQINVGYCMKMWMIIAVLATLGVWGYFQYHPEAQEVLRQNIPYFMNQTWALLSALLLSSFLWKYLLKRASHARGSLNKPYRRNR